MDDNTPFPFGKYEGTPIGKVPAEYLDWLIGIPWIKRWPAVERYILDNRAAIDAELGDDDE